MDIAPRPANGNLDGILSPMNDNNHKVHIEVCVEMPCEISVLSRILVQLAQLSEARATAICDEEAIIIMWEGPLPAG